MSFSKWRSLVDGTEIDSGIPDSVILQYFATNYTQGDATWPDDKGVADMSINGDPQDSTLSDGNESVKGDGSDDHGLTTPPASLEGSSLQSFAIELAVEWSHSNTGEAIAGVGNTSDSQRVFIDINRDSSFSTDGGNMVFAIQDVDGNTIETETGTTGLNDGNRHDITININDTTTNDITFIIDGSEITTPTQASTENPDNFGTWGYDLAHFGRNFGGVEFYADINLGAVRWHDSAISEQTISDY